jgi:flagellar biosynthesis protein FlhG
MSDQATILRNLVLREAAAGSGAHSRLIVVAGGKQDVGATTVSVNLAVALARAGLRTVLIDADLQQADAAVLCGCPLTPGLGDVLSSRRDIHEVLQRGPGGIQLVSGIATSEARLHCTAKKQQRFLRQLQSLSKHVDIVIVDAGNAPTDFARQWWASADDVLLVTTPDVVAVMDTYAAIKTLYTPAQFAPRLQLVVNHDDGASQANDVFRRIDQSCQRFLGISLKLAGSLAADPQAAQAARHGVPVLLLAPQAPWCRNLEHLVSALLPQDDQSPELRRAA